jgi:hypothetical protein
MAACLPRLTSFVERVAVCTPARKIVASAGRWNILMPPRGISMEASMRSISFSVTALLALLSSAALAQQPSGTKGETIGHPPPLPGPPSNSEPSSTTQAAPTDSTPRASNPAPKGYTGAYAPAGTPPTPYSTGPLPKEDGGLSRDVAGPDGSTKRVKAIPCSTAARETDGSTTCIGIPDERERPKKRRR